LTLDRSAMVICSAADGCHYVVGTDGTRLRCRVLLGGPHGDNSIDPKRPVALCLHGIGDDLTFWEDGVFRISPLSQDFAGFGDTGVSASPDAPGTAAAVQAQTRRSEERRWKFAKALAKRANVVMVDQRGFGGSDRPRTLVPIHDEALTILSRWKVTNMTSFTTAVRADLRISQSSGGAAAHCMSLSNGTALIRLTFWASQFYGAYLAAGGASVTLDGAELEDLEVEGPKERLQELAYFQQPFLEKASKYEKMKSSFHCDVACRDRVVVIHRLTAMGRERDAAQRWMEEVKDNDPFCISLSFSVAEGSIVTGIFQEMSAAVVHVHKLQQWCISVQDGNSGPRVSSVQLHAKSALLKQLAGTKLPKNLEIFQVFPLSFEDWNTTDRKATMEDFVADVDEIRKYCQVDQAMILGHSMGAAIALQYAVTYPHRVERLCLCAAAPKVGQAAYDNWMRIAGTGRSWAQQVIRNTVAVVNISDDSIRQLPAPTFLINAKDDTLTPLIGSEMIKSNLQLSMLYVPEFGGHGCLVRNDAAMERMVQFLFADPAMRFVVDVLLEEQLTSTWNLQKDQDFMRYYNCGRVLAELECMEREVRMMPKQLDHEQVTQKMEEAMQLLVQKRLGIQASVSETSTELVMAEMLRSRRRMSAPANDAVQRANVWWRDSGAAVKSGSKQNYTVDAWGRRRGGCRQGGCHLYRWTPLAVPVALRSRLAKGLDAELLKAEYFACLWCGGPASAHEDKGPASKEEFDEQHFFPALRSPKLELTAASTEVIAVTPWTAVN